MTQGENFLDGFASSVSSSSRLSSPSVSSPEIVEGADGLSRGADPYAYVASLAGTPLASGGGGGLGSTGSAGGVALFPAPLGDGSESTQMVFDATASARSSIKYKLLVVTQEWLDTYCGAAYGVGAFACCKQKASPGVANCGTNHKKKSSNWQLAAGDICVVEMKGDTPRRLLTSLLMKDGISKLEAGDRDQWATESQPETVWAQRFRNVDPASVRDDEAPAHAPVKAVVPSLASPAKARVKGAAVSLTEVEAPKLNAWKTKVPGDLADAVAKNIRSGVALRAQSLRLSDFTGLVADDVAKVGGHLDTIQTALGSPTKRTAMAGETVYDVLDKLVEEIGFVDSSLAPQTGDDGTAIGFAKKAAAQAVSVGAYVKSYEPALNLAKDLVDKGITAGNQVAVNAVALEARKLHDKAAEALGTFGTAFMAVVDGKIEAVKSLIDQSPTPASPTGVTDWADFLGGGSRGQVGEADVASILRELEASKTTVQTLERKLAELQAQFAQSSGNGVKLGSYQFNGYHDVYAWVMTHMSKDNFVFGCFMDCLTACEFMCDSEDGKETMASKIKNANGAGLASLSEVRVLTSIRNGLPALFTGGKTSSSACPLPRLDKFNKWEDDQQYDAGMKHEMSDFMATKLDRIITPKIDVLADPDARALATLMLQKTTRFWVMFIDQLSKTHTDLHSRLGLKMEEAWNFATNEARRVLKEVNDPRLSALDVGAEALKERAHVCATVLYALLKCHCVMQDFVEAQFKNHPSIGSERIKLLFNNMSKNGGGNHTEEINRLKAIAEKARTSSQSVQSRLDSMATTISQLQKALDKKADK